MADSTTSGSWYMRIDRYGSVHAVRSQDTIVRGNVDVSNSCGFASMVMVNFKVKKHLILDGISAGASVSAVPIVGTFIGAQLARAGIDAAVKSESEVYQIYTAITGSVYDGSTPVQSVHFPTILQRLGLGEWERVGVGEAGAYDGIQTGIDRGYPVICNIKWNSGTGAHFVVVDEIHTLFGPKLCVCDPWDGELRLVDAQSGQTINYDPTGFVWSFSVGGNRHSSAGGGPGKFSGWMVRKKV